MTFDVIGAVQVGRPAGLEAWLLELGNGQEFALLELDASGDRSRIAGVTAAERGVLGLVAEGLSNAQIAVRRGVSPRTVANQLASVFRKLGVRSRLELEARLARAGRAGDGSSEVARDAPSRARRGPPSRAHRGR